MEMILKCFTLVVCLSLCVFLAGGLRYTNASDVVREVTLTLPRTPAHDEAVRLIISAGVLPHGSSIIVRTMDGEIAGVVSPFGIRPGQPAGSYTIALPNTALKDGKVSVKLEVKQEGIEEVRPPNEQELLGAELVYIPITPFD